VVERHEIGVARVVAGFTKRPFHLGNHLNRRPGPSQSQAYLNRRRLALRHRLHRLRLHEGRERKRSRRVAIGVIAGLLLLPLVGSAIVLFALRDAVAASVGTHARFFPADSMVYDQAGGLIADLHPPGATRIPVPLTEISPLVQQAIVAVEDRNFWNEGAVDVPRLASAAFSDLTRGSSQGASTIPMQLAKILYLNDSKTISYKIQQIVLAQRIASSSSRAVILEEYLNDIYYGSGASGIEAAAHTYFGIDANRLDLAQAAMLAGIPNDPSLDDPHIDPITAASRQRQVLAAMVAAGDITTADATTAAHEHLVYATSNRDDINLVPFFTARVAKSVSTMWHLDAQTAGLGITSTLDLALQQYTQRAVSSQIAKLGRLHVTDGAAVVIAPASGDVLAYVGSAGPGVPGGQIDMAATPRQPGSSFKIFTYTTAIQNGSVSMVTPVLDGPLTLPTGAGPNGTQPYSPNDYDRKWHGILPVERALGNSLNIPAIRVELATGIPAIVATARSMGVTTLRGSPAAFRPSMTIGTYPVPVWEMAQAGSVLAESGVLHPARFIIKAVALDGHVLTDSVGAAKRVVDPRAAFIMNTMLSNDANRVMEFGSHGLLTLPGHLVAAKTGTSEDFKDNFTVGWTPEIATATWVGNANDSAMQGTTGITGAAPIWHAVMAHALARVPDRWPPQPPGLHMSNTAWGVAYFMPGTDATTGESALVPSNAPGSTDGVIPTGPLPKKRHHHHH
jgi:membrane peptidoglycan carboxypeptidase